MSQGFFVNGGGVGLEALRRRISEHLGPDIVIEPSTYNVSCWDRSLRLFAEMCLGHRRLYTPCKSTGDDCESIPQCKVPFLPLTIQESLKDLVRRTGAISVGAYKTKSNVVVTTTPVQDDDSLEESEEEDQSTHKDRSRTPSGIGRYLSHSYRIGLNQLYRSKPCLALGRRMHFRNFVGPDRETAPQNDTVVWNLLLLAMYFIALCLAARFPTNKVRIIFISISGLAFTVLSASVIMDLASRGRSMRR